MSGGESEQPSWGPLNPRERRVLGVLVEKSKTVPDSYPMTIAGLVTGCNQKSNRDPLTNYDDIDIEDILEECRRRGTAIRVDSGGRVPKWKHALYDWLKVDKVEMAVLAELLLRGPQTEGELRIRANRMCDREPIADLTALQSILEKLSARGLVIYLTPKGQKRGVVVTHGLYPPQELEAVRAKSASRLEDDESSEPPAASRGASPPPPALQAAVDRLAGEVEELRGLVQGLREELQALKESLGA